MVGRDVNELLTTRKSVCIQHDKQIFTRLVCLLNLKNSLKNITRDETFRRDGLKYFTFEFDMNTDLSIKLKYLIKYNNLEQTFVSNSLLNTFYPVSFQ